MRNVRVLLAYDGSRFFGWQRQAGFDSVQETIERALLGLTGSSVVVHGAGRTDTGVHAFGQVAHFHLETRLDDDRLRHALNHYLAPSISVRRLETCADDFHARFAAVKKRYLYLTATSRFRPPFAPNLCHWTSDPLDLRAMRIAAQPLVGRHDFSAFAGTRSKRSNNVRTLRPIRFLVRRQRLGLVVGADGFLYNMVRNIAGTLLEVGRGKMAPGEVARVLASKDRRRAGPTAPAAGLYLLRVSYADSVFQGPDRGPRGVPGVILS